MKLFNLERWKVVQNSVSCYKKKIGVSVVQFSLNFQIGPNFLLLMTYIPKMFPLSIGFKVLFLNILVDISLKFFLRSYTFTLRRI